MVITGGWCVAQRKKNIQRIPPSIEKKNRGKKNRKIKKEVPCIELANFDWIV